MKETRRSGRQVRLAVSLSALGLLLGSAYLLLGSAESDPPRATAASKMPKSDAPARGREHRIERPDGDDRIADEKTEYLASSAPRLSDPLHDADVEPHPVSEERLRMAKHHAWFEAMIQSLKQENYGLARSLLREHESEFDSEDGLEADRRGFERLLDCLDAPSESAREKAAEFIKQERLTPLRRSVRRVCLEGRDFR